jgi:hypothetical protein
MAPDAASRVIDGAGDDTTLAFEPGYVKTGKNAAAFAVYSASRTLAEYKTLHAGAASAASWRADLKYDISAGHAELHDAPRIGVCAFDEQGGLSSIEALDDRPPVGVHDSTYAPNISGDPRRHTAAYLRGARVARLSLAADMEEMPPLVDD